MKDLLHKYGHVWILAYFFIYMKWFFWLEHRKVAHLTIMHTRLDDLIPFNEYFIIPYLLWFVYIFATVGYLFLKNREEFYRICVYLFTGMTVCLLICTLLPNGTDLRTGVDPHKNLCSALVAMIHRVDTATNVFPSIHVYNSIVACICIFKSETFRKFRGIRPAALVLTILICMSTVFLKQHSVTDVTAGSLLALAIYPMVFSGQRQKAEAGKPETVH